MLPWELIYKIKSNLLETKLCIYIFNVAPMIMTLQWGILKNSRFRTIAFKVVLSFIHFFFLSNFLMFVVDILASKVFGRSSQHVGGAMWAGMKGYLSCFFSFFLSILRLLSVF